MIVEIPIWEKSNLTIQVAAAYFGIGMQKLRQLSAKEDCLLELVIENISEEFGEAL